MTRPGTRRRRFPWPGSRPAMDLLVRRVRQSLLQRELLRQGDTVAVAVSGGADSVALVRLLVELSEAVVHAPPRRSSALALPAFTIAGLIHVHHGLRGDEADADETFVRSLAETLRLPIAVERVDVQSARVRSPQSLEAAARLLRYRAFARAAERLEATRVATGHTADDQAETVLLRLFRGAGARGAGAIRARRGPYIRPLLDVRRAELRVFLASRGQAHRDDASNADIGIPRNRLRQRVMPVIEADWPGAVDAMARFADLAAADEACLTSNADRVAVDAIREGPDGVQVNVAALCGAATAISRRVMRRAIESAGGTASLLAIESLRRLLDRPAGSLRLRGVAVERSGPALWLRPATARIRPAAFDYGLPVPGAVAIPETRSSISASFYRGDRIPIQPDDANRAVLQQGALELPLRVRSRRPGDRLRPLGAPGSRKLQDVLIDRKVPRDQRDSVPLVLDATGRIVWVGGLVIGHESRVTSPEAGMVILDLKKGTQ